ncbi:MAG: hypothetical protein V4621_07455 [Pseudomonadota bacterium]
MDQNQVETTVAGVSLATIIFGFFGSAISLSYAKEMTRPRAIVAVIAGTVTAIAVTPLAMHYLNWPNALANGVSFLLGLVTLSAIPVIFSLVERVKDFKFPQLPDRKD